MVRDRASRGTRAAACAAFRAVDFVAKRYDLGTAVLGVVQLITESVHTSYGGGVSLGSGLNEDATGGSVEDIAGDTSGGVAGGGSLVGDGVSVAEGGGDGVCVAVGVSLGVGVRVGRGVAVSDGVSEAAGVSDAAGSPGPGSPAASPCSGAGVGTTSGTASMIVGSAGTATGLKVRGTRYGVSLIFCGLPGP
jgi:hypothetical protein